MTGINPKNKYDGYEPLKDVDSPKADAGKPKTPKKSWFSRSSKKENTTPYVKLEDVSSPKNVKKSQKK